MTAPTISRINRYFGPGLPPGGVDTAEEAYALGMLDARTSAIEDAFGLGTMSMREIAARYADLVRCISDATDAFIEANGTLLSTLEAELEQKARDGDEEQPDDIAERIREREMDQDHERQVEDEIADTIRKQETERELAARVRHATIVNADLATPAKPSSLEAELEAELGGDDKRQFHDMAFERGEG